MADEVTPEERTWFEAQRSRTVLALARAIEGGRTRYLAFALAPLLALWAMLIVSIIAKGGFDFQVLGVGVVVVVVSYWAVKNTQERWYRVPEDLARLRNPEPTSERLLHCARNRIDPDERLLRLVWAGCCVAAFFCVVMRDATAGAMGLTLAICSGVVAGWHGYRALASRPPRTIDCRPSVLEELMIPIFMEWVSLTAVNATAGTLEWSVQWYIDPHL